MFRSACNHSPGKSAVWVPHPRNPKRLDSPLDTIWLPGPWGFSEGVQSVLRVLWTKETTVSLPWWPRLTFRCRCARPSCCRWHSRILFESKQQRARPAKRQWPEQRPEGVLRCTFRRLAPPIWRRAIQWCLFQCCVCSGMEGLESKSQRSHCTRLFGLWLMATEWMCTQLPSWQRAAFGQV